MSLREDMWKYEQITGESAEHVPIIKLGAFLDGYDMAIKTLGQQPCEDCISRQAVKEMLSEEWTKYMPMEMDVNLSFVLEKISELPSITPKQKVGKWIKPNTEPWIKMGEGFTPYECSECEAVEFKKSKYCPNCGAEMQEVEE